MILSLHIPKNTYPERIIRQLEKLLYESANLTCPDLRTQKMSAVQFALQYCQEHYKNERYPLRLQIDHEGEVTIAQEPASNLRVFF